MSKGDSMSDTHSMSDASTLCDTSTHPVDKSRASAIGRPMKPYESNSLVYTESTAAFMTSAASHLPMAFNDESIISVPIKFADLEPLDPSNDTDDSLNDADHTATKKGKREGWLKRLLSGSSNEASNKFVMVDMRKVDYLRYWAKDDNGNFLSGVAAPPGGRRAWVERHTGPDMPARQPRTFAIS